MTCGLLAAWKKRKIECRAFKCGPDYIDPMFHKYVLGIDGGNLDTFFLPEEEVRNQFKDLAAGADLSVVEGVMGYYDGVGGNDTWASSYDTARALDAPVVLVLDCKGASLSLAAEIKGFLEYRKDSRIRGVILNRISPVMAERLVPEIEKLGISVFGYLPECDAAKVTSRHLGLVIPEESKALRERLEKDIRSGRREPDIMERSMARLPLYESMRTRKIDVTDISPREAAERIAAAILQEEEHGG